MLPSTINLIINLGIIILCLTLFYSVILMFGGNKIFKKANKDPKSAYIPVLNLFTLLDIVEMSTFWGILFFMPVTNLVVLSIMSYKLGNIFGCTKGFTWGLIFLPMIYYPLLANSKNVYKIGDEEYFKALDDAKHENISLLMTDEEIKEINSAHVEESNVDSIFKSDIELMEEVAPYRAANITPVGYEEAKKVDTFDEMQKIEIATPPEQITEEEPEESTSKFTSELEKEEEIEIVEL